MAGGINAEKKLGFNKDDDTRPRCLPPLCAGKRLAGCQGVARPHRSLSKKHTGTPKGPLRSLKAGSEKIHINIDSLTP